MPEARLERTRAAYDKAGNQFAAPTRMKPLHRHHRDAFDVVRYEHVCRCGLREDARYNDGKWHAITQ